MKRIHNQEREQFEELFRQEKVDHLEGRLNILDAFLNTEQHLTVSEISDLLKKKGLTYPSDFVRETLKLMCEFGFARKNRFDNGEIRYEHLHLGQHHDHMICTKCGRIIEFRDDDLEDRQIRVSAAQGFHMLQHRMEIYGICGDCLQTQKEQSFLSSAKAGEKLRIHEIAGGTGVKLQLMTLGLRIGDEFEVITNMGKGQLVVADGSRRFVLGRGLADKIITVPLR